jgi:cardiolipin synthase
MADHRTTSAWTVPNALTVSRIALTPAFVVAFVNESHVGAWLLFAAAGVTDALDGFFARILRQRSRLGAILDPLADKFLLITTFICLGLWAWVPSWLPVLVVAREVVILGGSGLLLFMGVNLSDRIAPSWLSKCNTTAQIVLIFYVLTLKAFAGGEPAGVFWLSLITAAFTVGSGAQYVYRGFQYAPNQDED